MEYVNNLLINNVTNIRDLGGYSTRNREAVCFGRFVRSGAVSNLTKDGMDYLLKYGIKTVIDLRQDDEIVKKPNAFKDVDLVKYYNIPVFGDYLEKLTTDEIMMLLASENDIHYIDIINDFDAMSRVFTVMAESEPGVILFNCELGTHRTGLISAILLMLAEVKPDDIIVDYSMSYTTINRLTKIEKMKDYDLPKHLLKMNQVINYMIIKYDSIENYFMDIGLSPENIKKLKDKLI